LAQDYIGQKTTFTCVKGYEFTTMEATTVEEPTVTTIGALVVPEGTWGAWVEAGSCSVTCAEGTVPMERVCDTPGACRGNYADVRTCSPGPCRE
jgi:hypothetical protein